MCVCVHVCVCMCVCVCIGVVWCTIGRGGGGESGTTGGV